MKSPVFNELYKSLEKTKVVKGCRIFRCSKGNFRKVHPLEVGCLRSNIILQQMDYSQRQDTQVAVEEAVAYPTSIRNANAELLKRVDMRSAIQRTHHWSPLHEEVHILSDVRCLLEDVGSL